MPDYAYRRDQEVDEPDVTPLINVNLVILVMVLLIAAHSVKLLPFKVPKAEPPKATTYIEAEEAVQLTVEREGTYGIEGRTGLGKEGIVGAIAALPEGEIVMIKMDPNAKYETLVYVLDALMGRSTIQVAFGLKQAPAPAAPAGGAATAPATP